MIGFVRRQPTRWVWPLFVAIELAFVFSRGGQFRGYWLWTADWTAGAVILAGPLAAAVAAWHARFQRKHMPEATAMSAGRMRSVRTVLVGQLVLAGTAQLAVVVVAVVYTATANHSASHLLHFVPQFFILAGFVAAGTGLGFLVSSPFTAPVVGVLAFVVQLPALGLLPRSLVKFGGATANLLGLDARTSIDLAQSLVGVGLVLVVVGSISWFLSRTRPNLLVAAATVAGALLVAGALVYLTNADVERFTSPTTISVSCSRVRPVDVCLPSDASALRGPLTHVVNEVHDVQSRLGVTGLPTRVVVVPAGAEPGAYTPGGTTRPLVVQDDDLLGTEAARLKAVLPYLVIDRRCLDANSDHDLAVALGDLQVAADIVLLELTHDPDTAAVSEVKTLQTWSADRRRAWLRQTLSAANSCTLSAMPRPVS